MSSLNGGGWLRGASLIALFFAAQNQTVVAQDQLARKNGTVIEGRIVSDDGERIKVLLAHEGAGTAHETVAVSDLDARTLYRREAGRLNQADGESQLRLADFALRAGLHALARKHFDRALVIDSLLEPRVTQGLGVLRSAVARALLDEAHRRARANDPEGASRLLRPLLQEHDDDAVSVEATALLSELAPALDAQRRKAIVEESARQEEARRQVVAPAIRLHDQGMVHERDGLLASRYQSAAIGHFKQALESCAQAEVLLQKLRSQKQSDAELMKLVAATEVAVRDHRVMTLLDLSSINMIRQSFNEALGWVNQAIALDPGSVEARAMRARVEIAASQNGRGTRSGGRRNVE